jgi:hypothetical protein
MKDGEGIAKLPEESRDAIAIRMLINNNDFADEPCLGYQRAQ